MIGILIVTHGEFSNGIVNAMELICGEQTELDTLSLFFGDSVEDFEAQIEKKALALDSGDGVLILVDFMNGTPANMTTRFAFSRDNMIVLAGMNFPMIIEAVNSRDCMGLQELAECCLTEGLAGVVDIKARLKNSM